MSDVNTFRFQRTIKILQGELNINSKVIEIGSNDASFRNYFDNEWTTVDKYGNPDFCCDVNGPDVELPFRSETFDVAVCTEVLEHLSLGGALVSELCRILRPGGVLFASVPNMVSLSSRIKWLIGRVPHMAASGDCGHPLGGTGIEVNGTWLAAHLVDFNLWRFKGYLERGGFVAEKFFPMSASVGQIRVPCALTPLTFADFLFAKAVKSNIAKK